jgi:hypothetical protein
MLSGKDSADVFFLHRSLGQLGDREIQIHFALLSLDFKLFLQQAVLVSTRNSA